MTTGLLRGLGLPVERGRSVSACSEHGACGSVHAGARVVVEGWGWGGGDRLEYYGLSVAR